MEELRYTHLTMPTVTLRGIIIFPDMIIHFDLNQEKSIKAVEQALIKESPILLVAQKQMMVEDPNLEDLYKVGTIAKVRQVNKLSNGTVRVLVEGERRGTLVDFLETDDNYLLAEVDEFVQIEEMRPENTTVAMVQHLDKLFKEYCSFYPKLGRGVERYFNKNPNLVQLIDVMTMSMPLDYKTKQKVLELSSLQERYDYITDVLYNEIEIARARVKLSEDLEGRVEKKQKEYLLREQLAYIREELGENKEYSDADNFEKALQKLKAKKEVKDRIKKEIVRFKNLATNSAESAVERTYIETMLEMPWDKTSKDNIDIQHAEEILQKQHYGLEQVKERILQYLAVRTLTQKGSMPIICLVGPPGTGKTSIGKSIAEALGKKYARISLGGVRDESEIRGHRKTYVGAMPGRIANSIKQAGVKNPLIMLDEIDKVGSDYKGNVSAALLEVLDSEQNIKFRDHYLEVPLDLSEVLFVATANTTSTIPRPLLDRMEIIEVNSYSSNEKFHIAKEHLVQKTWNKNGLTQEQLTISDGAIRKVIDNYTREAGVRELERKLGEICRKAARILLKGEINQVKVTSQNLEKYLGVQKYSSEDQRRESEVGVAHGLAWTSVGGQTLQIEVNKMPGKGEIKLTGQMGDIMKESAITGMSYVRSISHEYKIGPETFRKNDFHIHIPEGAVPKDGPSAGITMATALLSAITGIKVNADVAMTGEITLRGGVLPIGGLKEKILAANKAGMKKILVPAKNRKDVEEISKEIKGGMEIVYVSSMSEVIQQSFISMERG